MIDMPLYPTGYTVVLGSGRFDPQSRVLLDRGSPVGQISSRPRTQGRSKAHSRLNVTNHRRPFVAFLLVVTSKSSTFACLPLQDSPCMAMG